MKANEAPEKIYLFENPITETPDDRWLSKRSGDTDVEYTRTDAFIEKAVEWLKCQDEMVGISFQEDFIERFKNYMEGE